VTNLPGEWNSAKKGKDDERLKMNAPGLLIFEFLPPVGPGPSWLPCHATRRSCGAEAPTLAKPSVASWPPCPSLCHDHGREQREEVDGPPICERKREERVEEEKLTWQVTPRRTGDVDQNRAGFGCRVIRTVSIVRWCRLSGFVVLG
jgi:hypothetical protein